MSQDALISSFKNADPTQVDKWGAKGAKLAEDFQLMGKDFQGLEDRIAVPDGFIISTDVWRLYHAAGNRLTDDIYNHVLEALADLENRVGRGFGLCRGLGMPLIVAVRGGAPVSLPGALGTILNVGLNDEVVESMIAAGEDKSFALSTYLTAIRMYGEIVLEVPYQPFYDILQRHNVGGEGTLSVPLLPRLIREYKAVLGSARHPRFPSGFEANLSRQLRYAIEAIFSSWMAPSAVEARLSREGKIPDDMGTAAIVQKMVFGNRDDKNCLSGVFFTRNQRTGGNFPVIEWAPKVQCDKIVSGKIRKRLLQARQLKEQHPDVYDNLMIVKDRAESRAKRPLDIEFTVEARKLFLVQRRPLRMTFSAAVRAMWDLVDEGKTSIQMASMAINNALEQREKVVKEDFHDYEVLATGEPITNSADSGVLVLGTAEALERAKRGEGVILLRKRPYGETDVAVNHPNVRGVIRCDGNTTSHEAVSAVSYSKPYLINTVDADGRPLIVNDGDAVVMNPESPVARYLGRKVFVDGEQGILAFTEADDFLEDRKSRKKLYVDWEYLREQFDARKYGQLSYDELLDVHYDWELELEHYQELEKILKDEKITIEEEDLLETFRSYLAHLPERDRERTLHLKEVRVENFEFTPALRYKGTHLGRETLKILRALMLCTTWRTHWIHEILVEKARARGENENDVIRDIFLKNRTMSMLRSFESEGFHVMKGPKSYHLILASNFEYEQDPEYTKLGPETLRFAEKEELARQFMVFLKEVNPEVYGRVRMVEGEPPLGQGHARIISIGISIPHEDFDLVCRYLRSYLDKKLASGTGAGPLAAIPEGESVPLYQADPFFAPYPDYKITRQPETPEGARELLLAFGECSFGEFDGTMYGKEDYDRLMAAVKRFEDFAAARGWDLGVRPWQFEVDPYRRHSVIAAVGLRFDEKKLGDVTRALKAFLAAKEPSK